MWKDIRKCLEEAVLSIKKDVRELWGGERIAPGIRKVSHPTGEVLYFFNIFLQERNWLPQTFEEELRLKKLPEKYGIRTETDGCSVYFCPVSLARPEMPFIYFLESKLILRASAAALALGLDWDGLALDLHRAFVS